MGYPERNKIKDCKTDIRNFIVIGSREIEITKFRLILIIGLIIGLMLLIAPELLFLIIGVILIWLGLMCVGYIVYVVIGVVPS